MVDRCYLLKLTQGQTIFIPTGIHLFRQVLIYSDRFLFFQTDIHLFRQVFIYSDRYSFIPAGFYLFRQVFIYFYRVFIYSDWYSFISTGFYLHRQVFIYFDRFLFIPTVTIPLHFHLLFRYVLLHSDRHSYIPINIPIRIHSIPTNIHFHKGLFIPTDLPIFQQEFIYSDINLYVRFLDLILTFCFSSNLFND